MAFAGGFFSFFFVFLPLSFSIGLFERMEEVELHLEFVQTGLYVSLGALDAAMSCKVLGFSYVLFFDPKVNDRCTYLCKADQERVFTLQFVQ